MHVLIVAATDQEIKPTLQHFNFQYSTDHWVYQDRQIIISSIVTGPGLIATVYHLTHFLSKTKVDLVINVGIAGAFDINTPKGTIFTVFKDTIADLGTEHADGRFENIFDMGLIDKNAYPFEDGWIYPLGWQDHHNVPIASSVSINKVSGCHQTIQQLKEQYHPDLETMEGAGVFYVCNMLHIRSLQIRSISNHIEPRNKANWDIPLAVKNLNAYLINYIQDLHHAI